MERGRLRHLKQALAWTLPVACLFSGSSPSSGLLQEVRTGGSALWEVRLVVTAEGDYTIKGGKAPIAGTYTCKASWEGRLEPDGDDFLLVHLKTEIQEWRLVERSGPAGHESVLEAPAAAKPTLRMNYVLKDGYEVEFVFELGGIHVPLHACPLSVPLELPRSSGRTAGLQGQGYGDFVCRGSSRIVIPEADLERRTAERTSSWDWRREKHTVKAGRVFIVTQGHTAEAVITFTAH